MHVRRAYLRERVQAVIDAGGAKEMEDFWNADSGSDGEGDGGGEGDAGPFGDAALAEQRRTVRRSKFPSTGVCVDMSGVVWASVIRRASPPASARAPARLNLFRNNVITLLLI